MGDPACWLDRICPECAAVLEDGDPDRCPRCGWAPSSDEEAERDAAEHPLLPDDER